MDGANVPIRSRFVELESETVVLIQGIGAKARSTLRTVCGSGSRFFQCTVVPATMVIAVGANINSLMEIVVSEPGAPGASERAQSDTANSSGRANIDLVFMGFTREWCPSGSERPGGV